ncbi:hypothetical protein SDJN03_03307, partial [Cucurbita argyrosperma subsp. sororia]
MVPEKWGKEELLKDWIDYSTFDRILTADRIGVGKRASLVAGAAEQPPIQFTVTVEGLSPRLLFGSHLFGRPLYIYCQLPSKNPSLASSHQ